MMGTRQLGTLALFAWFSVLFFMCRDETPNCATGHKIECECTNNAIGVQTCNENGTYSACRCGSADGDTDADSDDSTDNDTGNDPACVDDVTDFGSCLDCFCDTELSACDINPDCLDLADCIVNCTDLSCQNDCAAVYANGINDLVDLLDCRDGNCDAYMGGDGDTDSDTDGDADSDTDADCESTVTDFDTCLDCYCGDVVEVCDADEDCIGLLNCLAECTDTTCEDACVAQFPDGIDPLVAVLDCLNADCSEYVNDETDCAVDVVDFDTCLTCYCDAEMSTCESNVDCIDLNDCLLNCTDDLCLEACANDYPDGVDDLTAVLDCRDDNCISYINDPSECAADVTDFETCLTCYCGGYVMVCENNPDCVSLLTCLNDCDADDADCIDACASEYADGINDFLDVIDCRDASCSDYLI